MQTVEEAKDMFRLGDIVRGKGNLPYGITNEDMLEGQIVDILDINSIKIIVLDHVHPGDGR